jgi:hypothetical protein
MTEQPGGTLRGEPDFPPNQNPNQYGDTWRQAPSGQPYLGAPGPGLGYQSTPTAPLPAGDKGFFGSLFDFGFTTYGMPRLIKTTYILLCTIIPLVWLVYVVAGFAARPGLGLVILVVGGVVVLISLSLYRIGFELVTVVFRIGDDVREIARRGR